MNVTNESPNPVLVPTGQKRRVSSTAVRARGTTPRYVS